LAAGSVHQDARDVKTKFSKTFTTYFFPVGDEIREIVAEWVQYLREEKLWGNDDPLFPVTRVAVGATRQFEAVGLARKHWSSASPIRSVFRDAFEGAGLPYFNPHSFRHTLVRLGETICQTPEDFKAWSQNLGHEGVLTTFYSYGDVSARRQGELIQGLSKPQASHTMTVEDMAEAVVRKMREADANASARTAI
jgi:integrase